MKDWVILTVSVSVLSSVFSLLLTESETKKAFSVLCGAVTVIVLIHPFVDFSEKLSDIDFENFDISFSDSFNEKNNEVIFSAVEIGYKELLNVHILETFDEIDSIHTEISDENDEYILEKTEIVLNRASGRCTLIEDEVRRITGSDCEVVFIEEY